MNVWNIWKKTEGTKQNVEKRIKDFEDVILLFNFSALHKLIMLIEIICQKCIDLILKINWKLYWYLTLSQYVVLQISLNCYKKNGW